MTTTLPALTRTQLMVALLEQWDLCERHWVIAVQQHQRVGVVVIVAMPDRPAERSAAHGAKMDVACTVAEVVAGIRVS